MNWSSGLTWLATLSRRRDPGEPDADHADMGTAFGLDASMSSSEMDCARAEVAAPSAPTHWEYRLIRRCGL
jgi:hypothetical protein